MQAYNEVFQYQVKIDSAYEHLYNEYIDWCIETFGDIYDKWGFDEINYSMVFKFVNEEDRNWFLLRWSK